MRVHACVSIHIHVHVYSIIILCDSLYVHIYMHMFTMYKCNFKYKIPLSGAWGFLDQVVGVVVLPGGQIHIHRDS